MRAGFEAARGEILMILDADLTTPPEDLPKFYNAIVSAKGELVMGTRLVYPMEDDAMLLFTWLLDQRITDTLCGDQGAAAPALRGHQARPPLLRGSSIPSGTSTPSSARPS